MPNVPETLFETEKELAPVAARLLRDMADLFDFEAKALASALAHFEKRPPEDRSEIEQIRTRLAEAKLQKEAGETGVQVIERTPKLEPGDRLLTGSLRDLQNRLLAGVPVRLRDQGVRGITLKTKTGAIGEFHFILKPDQTLDKAGNPRTFIVEVLDPYEKVVASSERLTFAADNFHRVDLVADLQAPAPGPAEKAGTVKGRKATPKSKTRSRGKKDDAPA